MSLSRTNEWGWVFLRAGAGLVFLGLGLKGLRSGGADLQEIAQTAVGISALLGLFVRPCALFVLVAMAWLSISTRSVSLSLVYASTAPILFAVGLLVGGGGTVLAVGYMLAGLRGRWWQ